MYIIRWNLSDARDRSLFDQDYILIMTSVLRSLCHTALSGSETAPTEMRKFNAALATIGDVPVYRYQGWIL